MVTKGMVPARGCADLSGSRRTCHLTRARGARFETTSLEIVDLGLALFNVLDPFLQCGDLILNGIRLRYRRVESICRAVKQRRAAPVGSAHLITIIHGQYGDLHQSFGLHLVGQALYDWTDGLLDGPFPCRTQSLLQRIYGSFPFLLVSITVEALFIVELLLYTADHLFDRLSACRRILLDESCIIIVPRHTAERNMRASLPARLVDQEQEGDIVREDDNLPILTFLRKPAGYNVAVHMIKR